VTVLDALLFFLAAIGSACILSTGFVVLAFTIARAKELPMPANTIEIMWGPFDGGRWNYEGIPCEGDEAKFVDQDTGKVHLYVAHRNRDGRWLWIYVKPLKERKQTPFCCEMAMG